jgi:hypothetical protein
MVLGSTQPLIEISTRKSSWWWRAAVALDWLFYLHLWADCLENVGPRRLTTYTDCYRDLSIYLSIYLSVCLSVWHLSIYLSIYEYQWLYSPLLDLGRFFKLLILCTICRAPWTVDQPVASPLPAHRTAQTQNTRTQTSLPLVGFEPTITAFERPETVHASECGATVISHYRVGYKTKQTLWF